MNFYKARRKSIRSIQALLQWWLNKNIKPSEDLEKSLDLDQALIMDSNFSTKATIAEPK